MKFDKFLFTALLILLTGCNNQQIQRNYLIDYPIDAARMSLGGHAEVAINCATREIEIISDSSNGIFSRHIKKRLSNICYKKTDKFDVIYRFDLAKGVKQDMIATHYPRVPPASNPNKPRDRNS